jgi:hypothetical protein
MAKLGGIEVFAWKKAADVVFHLTFCSPCTDDFPEYASSLIKFAGLSES